MNVNCPRDPLTCRCEYHSGRVLGRVESVTREGDTLYGRVRFDPPRKPIAPGVLLDDEPFYARLRRPRDWYGIRRLALRWAGSLALVVGAAAIMYAEGQRQPAPGVGFGIALALLMGAALLLGRSNDG